MRVEKQLVALKSLLESGRHECISGSRVDENLEVNPEKQEVEEEWDDNETNDPVCEMSVEVGLAFQRRSPKTKGSTYHGVSLLDIQNLPQVIQDGSPDAHKGKKADHLAAKSARQRSSSRKEPEPPCPCEFSVSLLVEFDITQDREGHEEDQSGIEEDESGLNDVSVVYISA